MLRTCFNYVLNVKHFRAIQVEKGTIENIIIIMYFARAYHLYVGTCYHPILTSNRLSIHLANRSDDSGKLFTLPSFCTA